MDSFESLTEVKSDGSTGDRYAICSWTNIEADREDIIEKLRKIAKTSSGSVYDKAELISRDDEPETEIDFDNPFDTTEDEEDEEIEGDPLGSVNPFDDLD